MKTCLKRDLIECEQKFKKDKNEEGDETAREIRETKIQIEKLLKPLKQIRFVSFDEGDVYGQPREPFLEFVGRGIFFGTNCNKFEFCWNNLHTPSFLLPMSVCVYVRVT